MKRAYAGSQYAKLYERYCRERWPGEAEAQYRTLLRELPDLGKSMMAANMLDWFTIVAFYEASGHRLDGEVLLELKRRQVERLRFVARFVDGNRSKWPYRLFEKIYVKFIKESQKHRAKGEWMDTWRVVLNPDHRTEGFSFHLVGCPIARHAKAHGYETLLPYLCKTDHYLAKLLHARLIRTQTEALGGTCCDYWYVGGQSPALEAYRGLEEI